MPRPPTQKLYERFDAIYPREYLPPRLPGPANLIPPNLVYLSAALSVPGPKKGP